MPSSFITVIKKIKTMLRDLLQALSDGEFHSGQELGEKLGVTRAAVWKQLQKLEQMNIPLSSVKGKGYRLQDKIELLDDESIKQHISGRIDCLDTLLTTDSTNSYLLDIASDHMGKRYAVLAEKQDAGRGRRGRTWVSPFGKNIYLSLLWSFNTGLAGLEGLSLMVAIAVEKALVRLGVDGVELKWPNDVYLNQKKLAGILLEVSGEYSGYCQVVIGIGINLNLSEQEAEDIDQPWAQLSEHLPEGTSRNEVVGVLLDELIKTIELFDKQGFEPMQNYWVERDVFYERQVNLILPNKTKQGVVKGVTRKGQLMLQTDKGVEVITAGELSLRGVDDSSS